MSTKNLVVSPNCGGGAEHIVPVLIAGVPNNEVQRRQESDMAFPSARTDIMAMPLAVNYLHFDVQKDRIERSAYGDAWHQLLANLFGRNRSEIEQRNKKREARRRRLIGSITAGLIAFAVTMTTSLA